MTVSTTSAKEYNVGQIVTIAHRQAGLSGDGVTPTESQMLAGVDLLGLIVQSTAAKGFFAKTVDFYNLTLIAADYTYSLPTNVIDVIGNAMYIPPGFTDVTQAAAETYVSAATREQWHSTSGKGSQGVPSFYWANRTASAVEVRLWPVPSSSEAGGVVRFQVHRLRADVTDRTTTVDVERFWTEWLVYQLAADLAIGAALPINRVQMLEAKAAGKLRDATAMAKENAPMRVRLDHRTSWGRR